MSQVDKSLLPQVTGVIFFTVANGWKLGAVEAILFVMVREYELIVWGNIVRFSDYHPWAQGTRRVQYIVGTG